MNATEPLPRPEAFALRGRVVCCGFLVDPAVVGVEAARRRVLDWWAPDVVVLCTPAGWWVRPRAPITLVPPHPGSPVVARDGAFVTVPVADPVWRELDPPIGSVVLARAGRLEVVSPEALRRLEPSTWLDVSDVALLEVPPPRAEALAPEAFEALVAGREHFGLGEEDAGREAVREALRQAEERPLRRRRAPEGLWARLRRGLGLDAPGAPRTGWPEGVSLHPALAERLARPHAEYLLQTLALFEEGRLDEALARAIGISRSDPTSDLPWMLAGVPTPREGLSPSLQGASQRVVVAHGMQEAMYQTFVTHYRRAAEALVRDGRIEAAAFVLADLLDAPQDAVALLSSHGHHALAARLAEARELGPEVAVREWWLAGDADRALLLVRRDEVFAKVRRLFEGEAWRPLRLAWARQLADSGRLADAAAMMWEEWTEAPDPALRDEVMALTRRAMRASGLPAARLLPYVLLAEPPGAARRELAEEALGRLLTLPGLDGLRQRLALGRTFVAMELQDDGVRALVDRVARALLSDATAAQPSLAMDAFSLARQLVRRSGNLALLDDLPGKWTSDEEAPDSVRIDETDRGVRVASDAVRLPDGSLLVAFGELGVERLDPRGGLIARFAQPAFRLVAGTETWRVLAVAPREERHTVAVLEVDEGTVEPWCEVMLDGFADTWDGNTWWVVCGGELMRMDLVVRGWRALRSAGALTPGASVRAIVVHGVEVQVDQGPVQPRFVHYTPGRALMPLSRQSSREPAWPAQAGFVVAVRVDGARAELDGFHTPAGTITTIGAAWPHAAAMIGSRVVHAGRVGEGVRVETSGVGDVVGHTVVLEGATSVRLRAVDPDHVVGFDDCGRVFVLGAAGLEGDLRL